MLDQKAWRVWLGEQTMQENVQSRGSCLLGSLKTDCCALLVHPVHARTSFSTSYLACGLEQTCKRGLDICGTGLLNTRISASLCGESCCTSLGRQCMHAGSITGSKAVFRIGNRDLHTNEA